MERTLDRRSRRSALPVPVRALALLTLLVLAVAPGAWAPGRAGLPPLPTVAAPPSTGATPPTSVEGGSTSPGALCLGCAGVALGMGGGTVLGVVFFASAWPGFVAGCLSACALAW